MRENESIAIMKKEKGKKGEKHSGKLKFHNGVWPTLGQLISLHYTGQAED